MNFSLNETTLLNAVQGGGIFSVINSIISPGYGIYLKSGAKALYPSSFLGIEYGADASVVSSPIEAGSYTSYNKVKRPPVIRVLFVLEGWSGLSGSLPNLTNFSLTSRADMLGALDAMVSSATTYDIETPDTVYQDYDLVRYNYRTSDRDVSLLTVEAIFQAVLQEAEVTLTSTTAQSNTTSNGTSQASSAVTEKVTGSTSAATQSSVSSALNGLKSSVSSASTSVANTVSSSVSNITQTTTSAINGASASAINKLSSTVSELVKVIT
ncbi:hypothetical protein [Pantoea ananatis]|uniref:hypothetical protein n=1 Tax=Pantoea ananas TaxID=553 RepID=UPI001B303E44|nr:hypothetical protein [Pantoea ananatis]